MSTQLNWDEYMNFQFGEFDSQVHNTYIVRNGEKLSFFNEDKKGVEQYSTSNKNFVYYGGATYNVKTKEVSMIAFCGNRNEFKKIMTYLATGRREKLTFGYQQDWCYDAVITNVTAATFHDDGRELLVEWKVTFGLYGNGEAIWNNLASYEFGSKIWDEDITPEHSIDNDLGLPLLIPIGTTNSYYLFSQGNGYNYININQDNITGVYYIKLNNEYICQYNFGDNNIGIRIQGRIWTYKNASGEFLESIDKDKNGYNNGMLWFRNDVIEVFEECPIADNYQGYLMVAYTGGKFYAWETQEEGESVDWKLIYQEKDPGLHSQYIIISPVVLELSRKFESQDWIEIEKHNNF